MKTRYKYIHFVCTEQKPKTAVWSCRNNSSGAELAEIKWYGPWRQYCFFPLGDATIYNRSCMNDIVDFINQISKKQLDARTPAQPDGSDNKK